MNNIPDKSEQSVHLLSASQTSSSSFIPATPLRKTKWRWVALALMTLLVFGDFVAIDNPQPLQTQFEQILGINSKQYSLLYSVWALPSIIIPFVGGYVTDRFGVRPALLSFSIAITLGQFIYTYGGYAKKFGWMLVGRGIYALGSDPINVAQMVITNKWFEGKEIAFALAVGASAYGFGRTLNSLLVPKLYEISEGLFIPTFFPTIFCVMALIATILMVTLDKLNDESEGDSGRATNAGEEEKISIKDIRHFKLIVWLIILNYSLINAIFNSFDAFANDLYHVQYNFSSFTAGLIISINFLLASLSSIVFGKLVDLYGHRATLILYSSFIGILPFIYYIFVPECDQCLSTIIPQIFFGLFIGINQAVTFPSLPIVLKTKYLGTGYGLFYVLQNIVLMALPPAAAAIQDDASTPNKGYFWTFVFFGGCSCIPILESVALYLLDRKHGRQLEKVIDQK